MDILCTRPSCPRPDNHFADLDQGNTLKTVQQKFCTTCGMPLILSGRYLPERLLGQGGFGTAYLARDRYTPTMRQCVVKVFQPSGDLSPDQLALAQTLFEREAAVLEDLGRHPQIPDLFAFFSLQVPGQRPGTQEEYFYLVQEFIDGEDLEKALARRGAFPATEVLAILVELLKLLDFVHQNEAIHRDIKPSNIMRHQNGTFYLLDFGAVKQVTSVQGMGGSAQGKSTGIYSMGFAPPEQMAGGTVYPSTDLYALAVTCIALLTGKPTQDLYDAYHNTWNWRSHCQINGAIADILDRMLLAAPNQRYPSAQDVLSALKAVVQGGSGNVTPTPAPAPTSTALQPAPTPPAQVTPTPPVPPVAPATAAPAPASLVEFLGGAAFTGFEGGLLAIAALSLLGTTLVGGGAWLILLGILVALQIGRVIERFDLVLISAITVAVVVAVPSLRSVFAASPAPLVVVLLIAGLGAVAMVAIATLFRLIYRLFSALF